MAKYDETTQNNVMFDRYTDTNGTVVYRDSDGDTFELVDYRLVEYTPNLTLEATRETNRFKNGL